MHTPIDHVFVGTLRPLPPEGQRTGMFKLPVDGPVTVTAEGLAGDRQADRRYHGGTEKALHHYPAEHYARLAQRYPERAGMLQAGVLGENLSTRGWTEDNVCIGDLFRVGSALVQLSQPRQPCWKINHRLDAEGASLFVAQEGITGWYYRVLETGIVAPGDTFALVERPNPELTVAAFLAATRAHRPNPGVLRAIAAAIGLAPELAQRLAGRAAWLENNP
ncbi:MOSC domain-containing protein [Aromatoleum diolicum]|uniref:MOSC domain-containing protein n=1 Tax=Aromatoleum diolicum TaxID=75796 RepID=A0ABX1QIE8_9RHOO|nr:MOSC domain-containing protein [Aromatoleum diolicum]NMG77390.1 MOSC domain-containing protein [Aromatoleum diolicum]